MSTWKQQKRALRRPFETAGFLVLKTIIPALPRGWVVDLAKGVGALAVCLPTHERRIGLTNLDAVFGDMKTPREKKRILQSSLATFCLTMADVFWFSRRPEQRILKYVDFEENELKVRFFQKRPVICITAHMGSWEVMGQTCALLGADLASIAATVKNPVVDRVLIEQRERTGQTIIPQKGALKTLIARFRKNGKAAFVLDQNTSEKLGGIPVDFLGFPMPVSPAPAALAYRTGTEIMLGFCLPEKAGRYRIRITRSIQPPAFDKALDPDEIAMALTQQIQDGISAEIRAHPEYWLWSYKHWRRCRMKTYPPNYPTY